ncbi:Amino acid transporter AVT6B-like protein [Drosera capensis]
MISSKLRPEPSAQPEGNPEAEPEENYTGHIVLVFPLIFHPLRLNFNSLVFPSAVPLASDNLRDRYGIAIKRDKIVSVSLIVIPVVSNLVAIYSDASSLL